MVTVISKDLDPSQVEVPPGKSARNPAYVRKALKAAKSLVPKKYEDRTTSPLTAEVKPQSNSFTFELTD